MKKNKLHTNKIKQRRNRTLQFCKYKTPCLQDK